MLRGIGIWLACVLSFLFLITLVVYVKALPEAMAYAPTGDALFDKYALAVRNRYGWCLFWGRRVPPYLPEQQLARWEREFGSDPRYWELRWYNSLCTKSWNLAGTYIWGPDDPSGFLKRAKETNGSELSSWILQLASTTSPETKPAAVEPGLREIIANFPDEAWPHYYLASILVQTDRAEEAFKELRLGNRALNNNYAYAPFPQSVVYQRMAKNEMPGSACISGAILIGAENPPGPPLLATKHMIHKAREMNDPALLRECQTAVARLGTAIGAPPDSGWPPLTWARGLLSKSIELNGPNYSADELAVVIKGRDEISSHISVFSQSPLDLMMADVSTNFGPLVYLVPSRYISEYAIQMHDYYYYPWKNSAAILEDFAALDLKHPVMPEAWQEKKPRSK